MRPSISFNPAHTFWSVCSTGFFVLVSIAFGFGGLRLITSDRDGLKGIAIIGAAAIILFQAIWYWREWLDRTTTITITDKEALIEVHKREVITFTKTIVADQVDRIYCKHYWANRSGYEVWIKLRNQQEILVLSTEYSGRDAIAIRHFLASNLNVTEDSQFSNRLW